MLKTNVIFLRPCGTEKTIFLYKFRLNEIVINLPTIDFNFEMQNTKREKQRFLTLVEEKKIQFYGIIILNKSMYNTYNEYFR